MQISQKFQTETITEAKDLSKNVKAKILGDSSDSATNSFFGSSEEVSVTHSSNIQKDSSSISCMGGVFKK